VAILRKLPYRHIVYCKDFFEEGSMYYMVLEYMDGAFRSRCVALSALRVLMIAFDPYRAHLYCRYLARPTSPGGELFDRVVQKTYYSEDEARNAIATILKAVNFMHARSVRSRHPPTDLPTYHPPLYPCCAS
jgi:serine/threonine protein kinase